MKIDKKCIFMHILRFVTFVTRSSRSSGKSVFAYNFACILKT
nr:MAG TPA: AAA domain protein [Caudoviricetes sp.]DAT97260.1 MAG TPA: AAA domain protein [Caudoviricetes sp.]